MPRPRDASYRAAVSRGMLASNSHRFVREVQQKYGTVTAWAAAHSVPLSTVASWYSARRKKTIPRHWADLIASEFRDKLSGKSLLPATRETWPNGIL